MITGFIKRGYRFASVLLLAMAATAHAGTKVEIIGHRGASFDAPENTVAAFNLSWAQKADASELDIHLTKDGKIVVLHDKDTKRVAGVDKLVVDQTFADIRMLDVGKWKGVKFAGEKLPTLDEMLATTPAGKRVFVEVKVGPEILPELDRVLKASKLKPEQTPIISFHAPVIAAVKKARPDLAAYWIVNIKPAKGKTPPTVDALIAQAKAIHADGLDLSATPALDQAYADKVKKAGLKLYVWTVNDEAEARRMAAIGVDGITTDRPGWLRELLGTVQSTPFRDLDGRTHTPLAQPAAKATVLFFILPDCPISNAYAPEIKRICKDYEAKQVASFVVHADPDVTAEQARKHAKEYGIACPVLRDPTHILVKHTGATIAPEVAVLSADGKLLYRGRIDDWYVDVGKRRAEPTQRDLRLALDAIVQGKTPPTPVTKAIGCYLPEPKK